MKFNLLPGVEFTPIDRSFVKVTVIRDLISWVIFAVILGVVGFMAFDSFGTWATVICSVALAVFVVLMVWDLWIDIRRARIIGYAELEEELLVRTGIMFQRVTMVPYGRMQQVNLETGPLLKKFGLAKIELITASADSNASIPGLPLAEAERLRDKLTRLGQAKLEGL